jgi:nitroimidazol reductase NimA-like FMN-containing flavoprotein (pyridoxamine 5'-phosphate oxidase superfamily)
MMTSFDGSAAALVPMARDECLRLLARERLGRIGVCVDQQPVLLPVNYAMDGNHIVFRTDPGTKLHAAIGRPVAFEIDGFDRLYHEGWSVLVVGTAEEVESAAELARLSRLPLGPWAPGPKAHWVRIRAGAITGRRLQVGA